MVSLGISTEENGIKSPLGIVICKDDLTLINEICTRTWENNITLYATGDVQPLPSTLLRLKTEDSFFIPNEDVNSYLDY